jgi:single-strand DNA-binding protein
MPSFNKVILCGNVTRKPELKFTASGTAVCNLGIAVNEKWKDANGQEREDVYFADCELFGRRAEVTAQYLDKGSSVLVEGSLRRSTWEKDGKTHSATRIKVDKIEFLGGRPRDAAAPPSSARRPFTPPPGIDDDPPVDDDVPF